MSASEFTGQTSNEAIQANLIILKLRDELNRMAAWDCVTKWANLTYISTIPGNPENPNAGAPLWQPGIPQPPWSYSYQYPVDCLRARFIIPQYTQNTSGPPIYPAGTVTGAGQIGWSGPALKFKVGTDQFYGVTAAAPLSTGTGFSVNDLVPLVQPQYTFQQNAAPVGQTAVVTSYTMDAGAPAILLVTAVNGSGAVTACTPVNQVAGETVSPTSGVQPPISGSYFSVQTNPVAQGISQSANNPGIPSGTGETFNLTFGSLAPQRVILCNQEQAILCYNTQVTDPNVMDDMFQDAWVHILAARLCFQLTGDKALANTLIGLTNQMIMEARKADGNEGITVNDVMPDFLRVRGNYGGPNWEFSPNSSFDWGSFFSPY